MYHVTRRRPRHQRALQLPDESGWAGWLNGNPLLIETVAAVCPAVRDET